MAQDSKKLLVGLDIGTSKVTVAVAEPVEQGFRVIGLGQHVSRGIDSGVVVNIEQTVLSIQEAVKEAEMMTDCKISRVCTGITGAHIRGNNSSGMIKVKDREVTPADISRAIETARAGSISEDQRLLLVAPQDYLVDGQRVRDPVSMSGSRLDVTVHVVTGSQTAWENVLKCVRRCGLEVELLSLQSMASSHGVLTEDEKQLGVAMIDIGAGTADVSVFMRGTVRHTAVIPIAGNLVTHDIAMALHTPTDKAEELKIQYGCAKAVLVEPNLKIEVPGLGNRVPRRLSASSLSGVIEPRIAEIFSYAEEAIKRSGYAESLSSGIVLTGGTALIPGITELGEEMFAQQVRVACPNYSGPLTDTLSSPRYASVFGLLRELHAHRRESNVATSRSQSVANVWGRVRQFFAENFYI